MDKILDSMRFQMNEKIFVKDPESSELGKNIIKEGIILMDEIGFDSFTFKKLGDRIQSNESSIYRYFENKHNFLVYLSAWYWSWMEYRIVFATANIDSPWLKVKTAFSLVTGLIEDDIATPHINEQALSRIIISEFSKTLHTKDVDKENLNGFYQIYIRLIHRLAEMVAAAAPAYPYPRALASTIVKGALQQYYAAKHLPELTECTVHINPSSIYIDLLESLIRAKK